MADINRISSEDRPPYRARPELPSASDPQTWPVVWRVVAPAAGSYDHDMVFLETTDEDDARKEHAKLVSEWPVRLERVSCGPLPPNAALDLERLRSASAQNSGAQMRTVLGAWTNQERRS